MEKAINKYFDICIIGGGAAGMVAGIAAARKNPSLSVVIVEKMEAVGKKVAAAGNGRCNLSNIKAPEWEKTSAFFSSCGLLTRIDSEGRVYPHSEDGRDVANCLESEAKSLGVEIMTRRQVSAVERASNKDGETEFRVTAVFNKPKAHHSTAEDADIIITAKKLLVATGGKSKPKLGTSGDGFTIAKALGHTVNRLIPILTGVETEEDVETLGLSGIREKCAVSLYKDGDMVFSDKGEIQFADYGVSGIVVFDMTRFMDLEEGDKEGFKKYSIEVDFLPDFDDNTLAQMIKERMPAAGAGAGEGASAGADAGAGASTIAGGCCETLLCSWVKAPIAKAILDAARTEEEILNGLKRFALHPKNLKGWDMAQVTRGGIPLGEIDEATGESKLVPNLYFAGEIVDKDFQCGGFNLQHAWTTGIRAGEAMAK